MWKKIITSIFMVSLVSVSWAQSSQEFIANSTKKILDKISTSNEAQYKSIIKEEVLPLFDWEQISKSTLGKNWRQMNVTQQKEFTKNFQSLLIKTYGNYIEPYKKASFTIVSVKKLDPMESIKLKLSTSNQEIIIDYRVLSDKNLIEDVIIEGISFVQVFKTGFNDEIAKNGIDAFLAKLSAKVS